MGGRNDQSVIKRPLLSRGERWVNRRLSYAFSFFQFGLKCEGTKRIPCDFFFFFFLLREDRLKFILRLTPKKVIKHFFVP